MRRIAGRGAATVCGGVGDEACAAGRFDEARELFERVALADDFADFLTLPAYERSID